MHKLSDKPHTVPPFVIYFFMVLGLVSAIAFRMLTILNSVNPAFFRPVWYFGVFGYILFFAYRYYISEKRKKTIRENKLLEKINNNQEINREDRELIGYVLASIIKSKENINYLFIFALSIIAIMVDLLLSR